MEERGRSVGLAAAAGAAWGGWGGGPEAQATARIDRREARRTLARPTPKLVSGYRSGASTPEGVGPAR